MINQLINSSFEVNQRGMSGDYPNDTYGLDRWHQTAQTIVADQSNTAPTNAVREVVLEKFFIGPAPSTLPMLSQPFESFDNRFAGKTMTFSVYLKATMGGRTETVEIGIGGSSQTFSVNDTWTEYKKTVTVANSSDWRKKGFFIQLLSSYDNAGVYVSSPQVVFGSEVGEYEPRLYADELAMCQRYYYSDKFYRSAERAVTKTVNSAQGRFGYPEVLRLKPSTVTWKYIAVFGQNSSNSEAGWDAFTSSTTSMTLGDYFAVISATIPQNLWTSTSDKPATMLARLNFDAEIYS